MENFITNILIANSRNITDLKIPLSNDSRQHLILTGKNGSGKTSLLFEINKYLTNIDNGNFKHYDNQQKNLLTIKRKLASPLPNESERVNLSRQEEQIEKWILGFGGVKVQFSKSEEFIFENSRKGEFIFAFFDSKRHTNLVVPHGINKVALKKKYLFNEKANSNFIQYIVNLKADRSFAKDDGENDVVEKIDNWFKRLEDRLKEIFGVDNLELRFDRKNYNFDILIDNVTPFNFNNLSDGYSAIISIVTELLLRMEAHEVKSYDLEGIVIIDEIETHLHVDLQKKILPFLTDFFPKIQFIVTTHSPFVLSSLSNATICDLETRTITTDLSSYSYDALLESYFKTDKYSFEIKEKITEFDNLTRLSEKTAEQIEQIRYLRNYFAHAPKYLSTELMVKLQQIELNELNNKS